MSHPAATPATPPPLTTLVAVGLLAATTLGMQVALTRHFSFLYWHHFAFMIIGLGMLGFGAAGAWLARGGGMTDPATAARTSVGTALAAAGGVCLYLLVGPRLSFAPLALLTQPAQFGQLLALYLLILIPFTALGLAQGAILAGNREHAHRVYAADLLGAGLGCFVTILVLDWRDAPDTMLVWGMVSAAAAGLLGLSQGGVRRFAPWVALVLLLIVDRQGVLRTRPFLPAPSKDVAAMFRGPDGSVRETIPIERTLSSATLRLDVVRPMAVPFKFGGDVDTSWKATPIPSHVVFQDGSAPTALFRIPDLNAAQYLGETSQGLAYQIRTAPRVCVIGAGGGPDVQIALHHGAGHVTAVEVNPQMLELGMEHYRAFVRDLFHRPDVTPVVAEGRHFLAATRDRYDVIQLSGVDTYAALASGAYALSEAYLYTVEAGVALLNALAPDGLITTSRWCLDPPRETLRLSSVYAEALRKVGSQNPAAHLFVMRAEDWATTLVSRRPFTGEELEILRAWTAARGWTVALDPNGTGFEQFVKLIHGAPDERARFLETYPYDVSPTADDRPFFFQLYKWRTLFGSPETRGGHIIQQVPVGYAVLGASLIQMAVLSVLFIYGPLWTQRSRLRGHPATGRRIAYFAALGVGFMCVEITALQMFTVFLGAPIYSMAITLAALLIATGLGSGRAGRSGLAPVPLVRRALMGLTLWVAVTVTVLPAVTGVAIAWPLPARAAVVALWLLPAGLMLGVPFPTAIRALEADTPALVPWAWGTNACASVLASLGVVLVSMQIGFRMTLVLVVLLYWVGFTAWRRTVPEPVSPRADI